MTRSARAGSAQARSPVDVGSIDHRSAAHRDQRAAADDPRRDHERDAVEEPERGEDLADAEEQRGSTTACANQASGPDHSARTGGPRLRRGGERQHDGHEHDETEEVGARGHAGACLPGQRGDLEDRGGRSRFVAVTAGTSPAAWGRICSQKKRAVRTLAS